MSVPNAVELPDPGVEELNREIGSNVRAWMAKRNITGKAMALELGIEPPSLSERLAGRTPFKAHELAIVAVRLDVSVNEFYGEFHLRRYLSLATGYDEPWQTSLDDLLHPAPELALA